MDDEKLNRILEDLMLHGRNVTANAASARNRKTKTEKLKELKFLFTCFNDIEKAKKQIEAEVGITEDELNAELGKIHNELIKKAGSIRRSVASALAVSDKELKIKYIDQALCDFRELMWKRDCLEALSGRLDLLGEENSCHNGKEEQ